MNTNYTVKKVNTGEKVTDTNGKEYTLLGNTCWAIFNEKGQYIEFFSSKTAAIFWIESIL